MKNNFSCCRCGQNKPDHAGEDASKYEVTEKQYEGLICFDCLDEVEFPNEQENS